MNEKQKISKNGNKNNITGYDALTEKYRKKLTVKSKKGLAIASIVGVMAIGGSVGAATYFGINRGTGGGSQPVTPVSDINVVTFNTNGGSFVEAKKVKHNERIDLSGVQTDRNGYNFAGWFLDKELKQPFNPATPIQKDMVLYAKWGCVEYDGAFEYEDCDGGVKITNLKYEYQSKLSIKVPSKIEDKDVVEIGSNVFGWNCKKLETVELPDTLKTIGQSAFSYSGIIHIDIPDSVTSIGSYAFSSCDRLEEIKLSNSLISISSNLFQYSSSLKQITIPSSVMLIEQNAFENCTSLETVVNNSKCTVLPSNLFYGCKSLKNVNIPATVIDIMNSAFYETDISEDTLIFDDQISGWANSSDEKFESKGDIVKCLKESGEWIKKASFEVEGVKNLQFLYKGNGEVALENVTEDKISGLGDTLTLPSEITYKTATGEEIDLKVTEIAYRGLTNIINQNVVTKIEIPSCIRSIGEYACGYEKYDDVASVLTEVDFVGEESELSILKKQAFANTKLKDIKINGVSDNNKLPEGLLEIETRAFENTDIEVITLPASLAVLNSEENYSVFYKTNKLQNIYVDQENEYFQDIDGVLFSKSNISNEYNHDDLIAFPTNRTDTNYVIPEGTKKILDHSFLLDRMDKITLPESLQEIESMAFRHYDKSGYYIVACKFKECVILSSDIANMDYSDLSSSGVLTLIENSSYVTIPSTITLGEDSYIKKEFAEAKQISDYNRFYKKDIQLYSDSYNSYKSDKKDLVSGEEYNFSVTIASGGLTCFYIVDADGNKIDLPDAANIKIYKGSTEIESSQYKVENNVIKPNGSLASFSESITFVFSISSDCLDARACLDNGD